MTPSDSTPEAAGPPATGAAFATTRWTIVMGAAAGEGADPSRAGMALEELCRLYWRPIYAFVRRQGHSPHDAQDLTQEFFGRLLGDHSLNRVHPDRGRFRSFLLASLKHFLANEWDKARALKRGGGVRIVPLEAGDREDGPGTDVAAVEPGTANSPEKAYDRQWAVTLLQRVLERLGAEHQSAGKARLFEHLRETLTADRASVPYAVLATRLGFSEGAVKVAVHRLRARYRELLREEIAETLSDPGQVEEELRELWAALAG